MPTVFNPPLDPSDPTPRQAPPWIPRIHTGYFYLNDRQYYLYAKKKTVTLRDATKYIFELASVPESGSVTVLVEGVPFHSFEVVGNELHLMATDQESFASFHHVLQYDETQYGFLLHGFAFGPSNQISVEYRTLIWEGTGAGSEPTGNVYQTHTVNETFRIKEAARIDYQLTKPRFIIKPTGDTLAGDTVDEASLPAHSGFLPDPPVGGAPTVITDDLYKYTDDRGFQTEFILDPISAELEFNTRRNYVQNPAFEITATGEAFRVPTYSHPLEWWSTDDLTVTEHTVNPFYGTKYRCIDGTGQLIQTIDTFDPNQPWTFSIYSMGDGTGRFSVSFIDSTGFYYDEDGLITATGEPHLDVRSFVTTLVPSTGWTRSSITFGTTDSTQCDATGVYEAIPAGAVRAEIKIGSVEGEICVDAVAAGQGYTPSDFEPLDPNITIEYETSLQGYWLAEPSGEFPLEINALDTNPIRAAVPGGFICVEEFSNIEDYGLGIGEIVTGDSIAYTGVVQITGAVGVNVGRKYLPYAKTSNFTKLEQRHQFHLENPPAFYDISDLTVEDGTPDPAPDSIEFISRDGLRTINDELQLVVIPDSRMVYRLDAVVLDQFSNPAYSFRTSAVAASGSIENEDPITNHLGQIDTNYSPPTLSTTGAIGQIDTITIVAGGATSTLPVFGYTPANLDLDEFLD